MTIYPHKKRLIFLFIFFVMIGYVSSKVVVPYIEKRPVFSITKNGLGNQMFQYAAARAYSLKHGRKLYHLKHSGRPYELDSLFNLNFPQKTVDEKGKLVSNSTYTIHAFDDTTIDILNGPFANPRWFDAYKKDIIADFQFKTPVSPKNKRLMDEMARKNSVSIHFRRGDYLTAPTYMKRSIALSYYEKTVQYIAMRVDNPHFYIFSDDVPWVKENFSLSYPHTFVEHNVGKESYNDMRLMSHCKHHILSNSSFAWWGAYLNPNPKKIVVSPDVWNLKNKQFTKEILPDDWIILPEL